jgi:hypothetical protein
MFSPDGKWLVSRGLSVRLWDLEAQNPKVGFVLPGSDNSNAAFSPDGRWLVHGDENGRIRLWDFEAVKHVYSADHWTLLRETNSQTGYRVSGLDLEIIPQIRLRDTLGEKYNPSYELTRSGDNSVDNEKDKQAELKENALRDQPTHGGSISGTITFAGEPPPLRRIDSSADPVCEVANPKLATEDWIVTDGKLANVFVYVKSGSRLDNYSFEAPTTEVLIERRGCQSIPHLVGVQTHQVLAFLNSDPTVHNFHPTPKLNQEWNNSLPAGAAPLYKEFDRAEIIPLKCNQHPWERSYIGVFSNPFFAISAKDGTYTIAGLPPGNYTIVAWHEGGAAASEQSFDVTIGPGDLKTKNFTFSKP